jgi:hypothetical protein
VLPGYNDQQEHCALATVTPAPICCCSCCAKNNIEPTSKSKKKQEQVDKQIVHEPCPKMNLIHTRSWGSESSKSGGLINTRVHYEVAEAKASTKQNPPYSWWLEHVFIHGKQPGAWGGTNPSLEWAPNELNIIQCPQPMFRSPTVF